MHEIENTSKLNTLKVFCYTFFAGLGFWLILNLGNLESLIIGIPTILLVCYAAHHSYRDVLVLVKPQYYLRFLTLFLYYSVLSGLDVVKRVLSKELKVNPGFYLYTTRLQTSVERTFFANIVSLIPGTISIRFIGDQLEVHAIDLQENIEEELRKVEDAIAPLFKSYKIGE